MTSYGFKDRNDALLLKKMAQERRYRTSQREPIFPEGSLAFPFHYVQVTDDEGVATVGNVVQSTPHGVFHGKILHGRLMNQETKIWVQFMDYYAIDGGFVDNPVAMSSFLLAECGKLYPARPAFRLSSGMQDVVDGETNEERTLFRAYMGAFGVLCKPNNGDIEAGASGQIEIYHRSKSTTGIIIPNATAEFAKCPDDTFCSYTRPGGLYMVHPLECIGA